MNQPPVSSGHLSRVVRAVVLVIALALTASACSGGGSGSGGTSSESDAKKAKTSLSAGLKAHSSGDLTTAKSDYKKTLTYDPKNKFAFYNLALIDEAGGNYGLAEQKYRNAIKTDPAYEPALYNLAILRTGPNPKEAIRLYKRAVAANKKDASAWLNLGLLLRASGYVSEGNKDVKRAIALNPKLKDPAKAAGTSTP